MSNTYLKLTVSELEDKIHATATKIHTLEHLQTKLMAQVQERILLDIERRSD